MEWTPNWKDLLKKYLEPFGSLFWDQRTSRAFGETVRGIITAGGLICQQIATHSSVLGAGKKGLQRVASLASGESTQRSDLDAELLTKRLRQVAVEKLEQTPEDELWLIADTSDLRRPYAEAIPYLMQVRDLDDELVPGYHKLNVIGLIPRCRGLSTTACSVVRPPILSVNRPKCKKRWCR